jgi:hypothetical protein
VRGSGASRVRGADLGMVARFKLMPNTIAPQARYALVFRGDAMAAPWRPDISRLCPHRASGALRTDWRGMQRRKHSLQTLRPPLPRARLCMDPDVWTHGECLREIVEVSRVVRAGADVDGRQEISNVPRSKRMRREQDECGASSGTLARSRPRFELVAIASTTSGCFSVLSCGFAPHFAKPLRNSARVRD